MAETLPSDPNIERVYEIAQDWIEEHEPPCSSKHCPLCDEPDERRPKDHHGQGQGLIRPAS